VINKSFLKWAGGKSKSIDFIYKTLPTKIGRFVEPFVGSAVVSLNIEADEYLLADYNMDLISLFKTLQEHGKDFIKYSHSFFDGGNDSAVFYYNRKRFNLLPFNTERAALFIYLNRHDFNGLCRYNASGGFNVPFGRYKTIYFPEKEMLYFLEKTKRFKFTCVSFEEVFKDQIKGDIIYCDPPYLPLNDTAYFTSYTGKGFSFEQHQQLVKCAEDSIGKVFISNHWVPGITEDLYAKGDYSRRINISRNIGAKTESRGKVEEVLVIYNNVNRKD